ncbi:MAG: dCMP deaminase family protein [Oscillospiraceae bacterium]|jgi:dCMP deaminase|nr:dCMP deaminase family protein [Oscillospiraceae bacterium]
MRRDKHNYYLDVAETILKRASCIRRNFGSVIVKNDQIISCGYTGAPRGRANCLDIGCCVRDKFKVPRGQRYEMCRSVHAEANAIIHASRKEMLGSTLYLVGKEKKCGSYVDGTAPCAMCKKLIINSGIERVISRENIDKFLVTEVELWVRSDESLDEIFGY